MNAHDRTIKIIEIVLCLAIEWSMARLGTVRQKSNTSKDGYEGRIGDFTR